MPRTRVTPNPALRLQIKHGVAIGPGKADLLEHIAATGSIAEAADLMQMSYRTAWQLMTQMNKHFAQPLVETAKGGAARGGAVLTPTGAEVLKLYRSMEQRAVRSIQKDVTRLEFLLKR